MGGAVRCHIYFARRVESSTRLTVPFAYRNWLWEKTCVVLLVAMIFIEIVWRIGFCPEDTLLPGVLCAASRF
eukprot:symbB.v1.2.037809.t1/scaffold5689.1/size24566/2